MCEVWTCTPSSSRSSGARRRVMTSHRRPLRLAATLNRTGALSRDTLVPERSFPVNVPSATTPLAVAWKLVIFALIDIEEDVAALADAGIANATMAAEAATMNEWGLMARRYPPADPVRRDFLTHRAGPDFRPTGRPRARRRTHPERGSATTTSTRRLGAEA